MKDFAINILLISGAITCLLLAPFLASADPLDSWHLRYSLTPVDGFFDILGDVTYGNGIFVAVGAKEAVYPVQAQDAAGAGVAPADASQRTEGLILTSLDGVTWTETLLVPDIRFNAVVYGNGVFVAVSYSDLILTSPDGINWTERTIGRTALLETVAYGNGTFVALGYKALFTSPDGITWTERPLDSALSLYGVAYCRNAFFAAGYSDITKGIILTSPDGLTWTETILEADLQGIPTRVTYANNTFVAVGTRGVILTSPDGITWTKRPSGRQHWLSGITYGNNTFVAVGWAGTILTSPDGITWKLHVSGYGNYLNTAPYGLTAVAYANNTFVAVGAYGTILQTDVTWSSVSIPLSSGWNFISIPLQPSDTAISEVLKDVSQDVRIVWGYDNQNKQWKKWKPGANSQQTAGSQGMLSTIEPGKGYWIYMTNDASMNVSGSDASPSITLYEGWNLAGYPGVSGYLMGLSSIMYKWDIIWSWDQGIWSARAADSLLQLPIPQLSTLNRGKAYWIKMNAGANWTQ